MGRKPGAEQRLQGAQAARRAWEELGFQHSAEENRITGGAQAGRVFPGEVSLARCHEPEERNPPCQGLQGVQGHSRTRTLLCLVSYTPPQTQHQRFGPVCHPKGTPNVSGMAGTRTGAPGVMSQVVVRSPLVMTKETSFSVEKES